MKHHVRTSLSKVWHKGSPWGCSPICVEHHVVVLGNIVRLGAGLSLGVAANMIAKQDHDCPCKVTSVNKNTIFLEYPSSIYHLNSFYLIFFDVLWRKTLLFSIIRSNMSSTACCGALNEVNILLEHYFSHFQQYSGSVWEFITIDARIFFSFSECQN